MNTETELQLASSIIARCEASVKGRLSPGKQGDLLADNTTLQPGKIAELVSSLNAGHGVGAFSLARARDMLAPGITRTFD